MAKGQRGRRPRSATQRPSGGGAARGRPQRRSRSGAPDDVPTALPGAAQAPAAASLRGTVFAPAGLPRAAVRARGGPRQGVDRHITRRLAAQHDFRYVNADLRWVGLTTALSVAVILLLWALLRL